MSACKQVILYIAETMFALMFYASCNIFHTKYYCPNLELHLETEVGSLLRYFRVQRRKDFLNISYLFYIHFNVFFTIFTFSFLLFLFHAILFIYLVSFCYFLFGYFTFRFFVYFLGLLSFPIHLPPPPTSSYKSLFELFPEELRKLF